MTDIVERLRACHGIISGDPECCCADAAAEIERLRHENMRLQTANEYAYDPRDGELSKLNREIERLRNLILGACDIFCQLDAPHWAAEFHRALEPKPDLRALLPELAVIAQVMKEGKP